MASKPVDQAVFDWLASDASFVSDMGKVFWERTDKGPKTKYIVLSQTGEGGERVFIGAEGGTAELELTVYAKTRELAATMRQAIKTKMKALRSVIGEYHYTVARLTGETDNGPDEPSGMYSISVSYDVEYTEE